MRTDNGNSMFDVEVFRLQRHEFVMRVTPPARSFRATNELLLRERRNSFLHLLPHSASYLQARKELSLFPKSLLLPMFGGPVFSLRLLGLICPCFEKEEDKGARTALHELNRLGKVVDWHVGNKGGAKGFVQSLFRQNSDETPPTPSQLRLVDGTKDSINNGDPFPELQIKPLPSLGDLSTTKGKRKKKSVDYRLDIPLHHICSIESVEPSTIVIITKDVHSTEETDRTTKEAARISWQSADDRDAVSLDLKVLVEWNKNRQPEVEEEFAADGIKARAKKAAHFAKREYEMHETKKSREKRKQKFLQDGGMKFTALAMASREIS